MSSREALPQTADSSPPNELIPPHLTTGGGPLTSGASTSYAVVNPNPNTTLRVDWIRHDMDQSNSIISKTDVPPGQSVVIGYGKMNGGRCTYELSGWDKIHSREKARKTPRQLISSTNEPAPRA